MLDPAGVLPPALTDAAGEAFPGVACTAVPELATAMERPLCDGLELLCIAAEPVAGEVPPDGLLDGDSLPRWGVVQFAGAAPDLTKTAWSKEALTAVLKEAATRHALSRDNARLRGELLTMARRVSHDLRTPLGGIIATVDMLAETIPAVGQSASPVFAAIDEITKIITRTSSLLKAIAQPLPRTLLNMGTAVGEALRRLERPLFEKQATLHQPDGWPDVAGVAPWLELIWWNLIHNSLQYSSTPQIITMGWEKEAQGHRFWIRDSGPGLPGSSHRPAFPSFHLLHDPNAGHGLGLPIVRRLTELQGGTCGYHQNAGESPTFSFFLPEDV